MREVGGYMTGTEWRGVAEGPASGTEVVITEGTMIGLQAYSVLAIATPFSSVSGQRAGVRMKSPLLICCLLRTPTSRDAQDESTVESGIARMRGTQHRRRRILIYLQMYVHESTGKRRTRELSYMCTGKQV